MSRQPRAHLQHRLSPPNKLNLVALMDIFTILVFFLMVNSSEVKVLQSNKDIELPKAAAQALPEDSLRLTIGSSHIFIQDQPIVALASIQAQQETIPALQKELEYRAQRRRDSLTDRSTTNTADELDRGFPITILGDQEVRYRLLKQVLTTCANTDYRDIALATHYQQKVGADSAAMPGASS